MNGTTEILFAESSTFTSKYALWKKDVYKSKLNESGEIVLILESLILDALDSDNLGAEEISLDIDKIASDYVKRLYKYKKLHDVSQRNVVSRRFGQVINKTLEDYVGGVKNGRGRPCIDPQAVEFGKMYMEMFAKDLVLNIVEKIGELDSYSCVEGRYSYKVEFGDKLVLKRVNV
jgi:hypothetical protein